MPKPPVVSFMSANFVARELGYRMTEGWQQGDRATQAHFRPEATFAARFEEILLEVKALGFAAMDLWGGHLHYGWATPIQVVEAKRLLAQHGLVVPSYAGWVPGGEAELRRACALCRELGIPVIGGFVELAHTDRTAAVRVLREFGVVYGYENHAGSTPAEVLAKIGADAEDVIGVAFDTGWCGTHGVDAVAVVRALGPRIVNLHLKDVLPRGSTKTGLELTDAGHATCRLGTGIVPVAAVVRELVAQGYSGGIAVEHEPELFDPRPDCRAGLHDVQRWLAAASPTG